MKAIIFDLDGVIYRGSEPVAGVADTLKVLRKKGLKIFFMTNNSTKTRAFFVKKLMKMGIESHLNQIMTSGYATALYFKGNKIDDATILVIGEWGLKAELRKAGLSVVSYKDNVKIDFVVAGMDRNFNYYKLAKVQEAILKGAKFIATNRDPTFPTEHGLLPGGGSIVSAIETASGVKPLVIGKPEVYAVSKILELANLAPQETLIVGDRLDTDILVGKRLGIKTALVLGGVTSEEDVKKAPLELQPDWVVGDVRELLVIIKKIEQRSDEVG